MQVTAFNYRGAHEHDRKYHTFATANVWFNDLIAKVPEKGTYLHAGARNGRLGMVLEISIFPATASGKRRYYELEGLSIDEYEVLHRAYTEYRRISA